MAHRIFAHVVAAALAVWPAAAITGVSNPSPPGDDAYAPLERYDGRWLLTPRGGVGMTLENHCTRTGLFFVCEQVVDGKSLALVIFRPESASAKGWTYSTRVLLRSGDGVGRWGPLTIEGDYWIYGPAVTTGPAPQERTINQFDGQDHIHYETQTSTDGVRWLTQSSGDEHRRR